MPQINKPTDYFNTKLYTGNGTDDTGITGVGFQPDFTWIKSRGDTSPHNLFDVIRGATKRLFSNNTDAENTASTTLQSFDSDGFTVGTGGDVNGNTINYASWNWLAGGTASSNTDGSITSSVSASTTSGFSIVKISSGTGANATIGHGLGVAPKMVIGKRLDSADSWTCYHAGIGATKFLELDTTIAEFTASTVWNDTAPTSSVFSVGSSSRVNASSGSHIFYCFAEKKGFSKFGSYTGNGSTDGTFVYTGMRPSLVITKRTSTSGTGWVMMDNKRETTNDGATNYLLANDSVAETSASFAVDFLSNGFKPRTNSGGTNTSGETYIYMAFAQNPLVGTNNIPATAR